MKTSALRDALGDRADVLDEMNTCDVAGCKDPAHEHPIVAAAPTEDDEMTMPDVGEESEMDAADPDWDVDPAVATAVKSGMPMQAPMNPSVAAYASIGGTGAKVMG